MENISIYECSVGRNDSFYSELDEIGCHFSPKLTFIHLIRIYFVNIVIIKEDFCARISFCFYQYSLCLNWFPIYRNLFVYSGSEYEFFKDESPSKCNSTEKHILKVSFFVPEVKLQGWYPYKLVSPLAYLKNKICA